MPSDYHIAKPVIVCRRQSALSYANKPGLSAAHLESCGAGLCNQVPDPDIGVVAARDDHQLLWMEDDPEYDAPARIIFLLIKNLYSVVWLHRPWPRVQASRPQ